MGYEVIIIPFSRAGTDPEGVKWCGLTLLLHHITGTAARDFLKSLKQVRKKTTLHLFSPPCSVAHPFSSHSSTCCCPWLTKRQGNLQSCFCPTPAGLSRDPDSAGDNGSNRWVSPPCLVPELFPASLEAGTGRGTCLLPLLLAEPGAPCSSAGVEKEKF